MSIDKYLPAWLKPKTAKQRWDDDNLRTVCTRLKTSQAEAFGEVCAAHGMTRYEAIRRFCLTVMLNDGLLDQLHKEH